MPKPRKTSTASESELRERDPAKWRQKRVTGQQRIFVEELQADPTMSPTEAARKAGYKHPPTSGRDLMNNPTIRAMVLKAQQDRLKETALNALEVDNQLMALLMFDPAEVFSHKGGKLELKQLDSIPPAVRRSINGMEITEKHFEGGSSVTMKITWPDKLAAAKLAYQRLGEITGDDGDKGDNIVNINLGGLRDALSGPSPVITDDIIDGEVAKTAANARRLPAPKKRAKK